MTGGLVRSGFGLRPELPSAAVASLWAAGKVPMVTIQGAQPRARPCGVSTTLSPGRNGEYAPYTNIP